MYKIIFFFFCFISLNSFSFTESKYMATVTGDNLKELVLTLRSLDMDIASISHQTKEVDLVLSDLDYKILKNKGIHPKIFNVKGVSEMLGPDKEYKRPEDIERILKDYETRFPHLTKLISIGKSLEGRDIFALKISNNPELDESKTKPTVLFNGMHHAREVMSPEIVLDTIDYLLTRYETDSEVKNWVDHTSIWLMPMFNVDGNNKMWNDDNWWRKNVRGGFGVDLNRNYPYGFNSCDGSSSSKGAQDYRGESAASEPETKAMMNFVEDIRPVFNISYHSYSELVIYPYGCRPLRAETKEIVEGIGKEVAKKIGYKPGTAWELLYNADGGDIDWMYHEFGVLSYVIEVNSRLQGFQPSFKRWRDKTVVQNRPGWMYLLDRSLSSGVHGFINLSRKDYSNIKIEISKNNKFLSSYKVHANGSFHLILAKGEYELKFVEDSNKEILRKKIKVSDKLSQVEL